MLTLLAALLVNSLQQFSHLSLSSAQHPLLVFLYEELIFHRWQLFMIHWHIELGFIEMAKSMKVSSDSARLTFEQ